MRTKFFVGILVLLALAVPASPAHAGGVVTVCDEAHLRAALAGGGTVTFACSGTITLTAEIMIAADTSIDGSGQDVTISGNNTVRVFTLNEGVTLNISKLTITNGNAGPTTQDDGGGVRNDGGVLIVRHCTFTGNNALSSNGGSISNANSGTVTVSNSTFSGNSADHSGGAIYIDNGTVTVSSSTFSGNSARQVGGGIANGDGAVSVSNSTFSANRALDGGGTYNLGALTVSNSTLSRNIGGGIMNVARSGAVATGLVVNSTVYGHDGGWGGVANIGGAMTLKNTIVANSHGMNCVGAITDGGGNLSHPDTTCPGINADPKLGPLQNNGGPTWTMALLPGSAAIDAGIDAICAADPINNLDQRGVTRPQGAHCDIGAVEQSPYRSMWLPTMLVR